MKTYSQLVITALGKDRSGIVDSISKFVLERNGNIEDSRMAVLGGEFAVIMLITGETDCIKKISEQIPVLEKTSGLTFISKETTQTGASSACVPYSISIVGLDHPGVVHSISSYLAHNKINIEAIETGTYKAPITGTAMFKMDATVSVPSSMSVAEFHRQIEKIAEAENVDVQVEAVK